MNWLAFPLQARQQTAAEIKAVPAAPLLSIQKAKLQAKGESLKLQCIQSTPTAPREGLVSKPELQGGESRTLGLWLGFL